MIDIKTAISLAKEYYFTRGAQIITKLYDAEDKWIVYGGKEGQAKIGGAAIAIDKQTGEIGKFILPSKDNFAILKRATLIDIEEE